MKNKKKIACTSLLSLGILAGGTFMGNSTASAANLVDSKGTHSNHATIQSYLQEALSEKEMKALLDHNWDYLSKEIAAAKKIATGKERDALIALENYQIGFSDLALDRYFYRDTQIQRDKHRKIQSDFISAANAIDRNHKIFKTYIENLNKKRQYLEMLNKQEYNPCHVRIFSLIQQTLGLLK
ncbi:hypothetical protein F8158_29035 [Bacillus cereus]|uniref:Uncharacterized protein n=1 Tax=Bacillus cereus TaxID=1396 RepID=A0AB34D9G0_BACCE|nr:hypothetical protein [Bacillus cereus]KAB2491331.1 hypothetical protein F8158_29035 [Bacillus cereus]